MVTGLELNRRFDLSIFEFPKLRHPARLVFSRRGRGQGSSRRTPVRSASVESMSALVATR